MSDGLTPVDNSDHERIRGLLARSANVIAAARQELVKRSPSVDPHPLMHSENGKLSSHAALYSRTASAQRRALFRELLRAPELSAASSREGSCLRFAGTAATKNSRHGKPPLRAPSNEELGTREERVKWQPKRQNKKRGSSQDVPHRVSIFPASWTGRLDDLITAIAATALLVSWFAYGSPAGLPADSASAAIDAQTSSKEQGAKDLSSPIAPDGFNLLSQAFPKPLPTMAEDIPTLLFFARPLLASAPGITVVFYMDLPKPLAPVPKNISSLIRIATPQRN